jgi:hypothetical protein
MAALVGDGHTLVSFPQLRTCWQPTHIFLDNSQSCLHPLRYLNEIFVAFHQWKYDSFSQPLQFDFDSVFTIANVKTPTSLTVLSSSS